MGDVLAQDRMRPDREGLFQSAASQRGYFTVADAREHGYSRALLAHHAKAGTFRRIRPGLYRFRDYPQTPGEELTAAWLALGGRDRGAVVSHESALDLWGLTDAIPDTSHVTVPRTRRHLPHLPGVTVHTTGRSFEPDDVQTLEGMQVTTPARTLLDIAEAQGTDEDLGQSVSRAIQKGWVTRDALEAKAARRGPRATRLVERLLATFSFSQNLQAGQA